MERTEKPAPELFTASKLASFCQVDLKTIHNWADKGEIRHFRTPGRHLRFRRQDVLDFLRKYNYPIPEELKSEKPKIVIVDSDPLLLATLRRSLAHLFEITTFQEPLDALVNIGGLEADAIVMDIVHEGLDGLRLLESLRVMDATAHIRPVAYSSHGDKKQAALDAGALEFIDRRTIDEDATALREALERLTGLT